MRHLNRDLWLLYAANFLFAVGMGLYVPLWPAYVRQLGGTPVHIGLLAAIGGAAALVFAIPAGLLADRFERRAQILWGWVVAIPVPVIFALAGSWAALAPGVLFFNAGMIFLPALQAYVMEKAPTGRDAFVYSFVMSSFPLGSVIGPPIGGWLADHSGIRVVFWAVAALWTLATLASLPISRQYPSRELNRRHGVTGEAAGSEPPEAVTHTAQGRPPAVRRWLDSLFYLSPGVLAFALLFFVVFGLQGLAGTFVTPFLQDVAKVDLFWISALAAVAALGATVASPVIGWFGDRYGKLRVFGVVLVAVMSGFLGLLVAAPLLGRMGGIGEAPGARLWSAPFLLLAFSSLARGIGGMSLAVAAVGGMVPKEKRGRVLAVIQVANSLGMTVGPYIGGHLYERNPYLPFFTIVAFFSVIGLLLVTRAGRRAGGARGGVSDRRV